MSVAAVESLEARAMLAAVPSSVGLEQIQQPQALVFVAQFGESRQQVIAVIDTGVDPRAIPADRLWQNPGEVAGDGLDNDGNGYVDDVSGWNFGSGTNDTRDINGHGSKVASEILLIDPSAMILPVKLGDGPFSSDSLYRAVMYVEAFSRRGEPVVAANMSVGGGAYDYRLASFFTTSDIVWVAAAGNENRKLSESSTFWPASYNGVLSVAANVSGKPTRASYSNYGGVDVSAPGSWTVTSNRGRPVGFAGTSAAAPAVAGVVSLVARVDPDKADIVAAITDTATPNGYTRSGLVDAFGAVTTAYARAA